MAGNIGLKIGIDGEAEYKKKLSNIIQEAKTLAAEMDKVSKSFDDNAESEDNARKKSDILKDAVANQTKKVDLLQEMVNKATDKYGENATETLKLKEALYKAEGEEKDLKKQQEDLSDAVEDGTESVEKSTDKWDKFKDVAGKVAAGIGSAVAAITAGGVAFAKEVVSSYGELEQNLGGAKAVFGEYADQIVEESTTAYKKLGLSQSEYLASANKTAALFQGSGVEQEKSLELTTQAMQRAADMASVMGIDATVAMDAITGAAKNNFTMMDNIGVAMNATTLSAYAMSKGLGEISDSETDKKLLKIEQAQIKLEKATKAADDAEVAYNTAVVLKGEESEEAANALLKLRDAQNKVSLETIAYNDAVEKAGESTSNWWKEASNAEKAELAMQYFLEQTTQYANNFEQEATETVTGSLGLLTASVEDFIASLGNRDADIGQAAQNIVDAFVAVVDNLVPIINNLWPAIEEAVRAILESCGDIFGDLLEIAGSVFSDILIYATELLPDLIPIVFDAVMLIIETLVSLLPDIFSAAAQIILTLANGIGEALPDLIPTIVDCILTIVDNLTKPDSISMIIDAAIAIMEGLTYGILNAIPLIIERVPDIIIQFVGAILDNLPKLLESGIKMILEVVAGILKALPEIGKAIGKLVVAVKDALFGNGGAKFKQWGSDMINGIVNGIKASIGKVKDAAKSVANTVSSWLHFSRPDVGPLRDYETWMPDMINGMVKGIHENQYKLSNAMYDLTAGASGVNGVGRGGSITNMGGVSINVQAAPGQSESAIADAVMEKMQRVYEGRTTVWA